MDWSSCLVNGVPTLQCIPIVLHNVIQATLIFVGIAAVVIIIISGIRYTMSSGESKQMDNAKKGITFAIIGLLIVLFSFFLLNIISYFTGVSCVANGSC